MKGRTRQEGRHTGTEDPPESLSCARNPEPENMDALGLQMPHARHKRSSSLGHRTARQERGGRKAWHCHTNAGATHLHLDCCHLPPRAWAEERLSSEVCRWVHRQGSPRAVGNSTRKQEAEGAAAEPTARNSPRQGTALGTHGRGTVTRPGTRPAYKQPTEERHCRVGAQHALRSLPGPREDGRPGCPVLIHTTGQIRHHMPAPRHCHHGAPIPNRTPTKSQAEAQ